MKRRSMPSVNAGSMADIAFLLLIFFLVSTTIETDKGINRQLPPLQEDDSKIVVRERNVFNVELNQLNQLLVDGKLLQVDQLKGEIVTFLDNGGGKGETHCSYCQGQALSQFSEHPNKAIISFKNSREANYESYIAVQNELVSAYQELYDREAMRLYGMSYETMKGQLRSVHYDGDKNALRDRMKTIEGMFPERISESQSSI